MHCFIASVQVSSLHDCFLIGTWFFSWCWGLSIVPIISFNYEILELYVDIFRGCSLVSFATVWSLTLSAPTKRTCLNPHLFSFCLVREPSVSCQSFNFGFFNVSPLFWLRTSLSKWAVCTALLYHVSTCNKHSAHFKLAGHLISARGIFVPTVELESPPFTSRLFGNIISASFSLYSVKSRVCVLHTGGYAATNLTTLTFPAVFLLPHSNQPSQSNKPFSLVHQHAILVINFDPVESLGCFLYSVNWITSAELLATIRRTSQNLLQLLMPLALRLSGSSFFPSVLPIPSIFLSYFNFWAVAFF